MSEKSTPKTKGIPGRRLTVRQSESARERIRVGVILSRLQDHLEGKIDLSQSQTAAAKTLLDRAMPVLSAVEMTQHEELPQEGDLHERMLQMLKQHPSLAKSLWQPITELLLSATPIEGWESRLSPLLSAPESARRALLELLPATFHVEQQQEDAA